jgi:acetyl-CoA acetyltransferase family protein
MTPTVRRVAIIGGNRIPFARSDGPYATASNQEMLSAALAGLVDRFDLRGAQLGEFVAGAVLKHSRDFNLAREVVLGSELDSRTSAFDLQQACGTGLEAAILIANKIALGQIDAGIAGGSDTASDAPLGLNDELRQVLLRARRAKSFPKQLGALSGVRPRHVVPDIPRNAEPRTGLSMGEHAALTARQWRVPREAQDELAATSHQRLAAAYDRNFFEDLLTPFRGLERDQNLRPDSTAEKLARLKPVFGKGEDATMTAGNSTPLTDGAATVLLASDPNFTVGTRMEGTDELGFATGRGDSALDVQLLNHRARVQAGDRLVTFGSADGKPFVPGVPVGEVVSVEAAAGDLTRTVRVRPYVAFTQLDLVGVVIEPPRKNPRDSVLPPPPEEAKKDEPADEEDDEDEDDE